MPEITEQPFGSSAHCYASRLGQMSPRQPPTAFPWENPHPGQPTPHWISHPQGDAGSAPSLWNRGAHASMSITDSRRGWNRGTTILYHLQQNIGNLISLPSINHGDYSVPGRSLLPSGFSARCIFKPPLDTSIYYQAVSSGYWVNSGASKPFRSHPIMQLF